MNSLKNVQVRKPNTGPRLTLVTSLIANVA
jgi:hypothetical protein